MCFLQGFTQVYVGDERSYKLGKLGPGQRFSFKIRVSSSSRSSSSRISRSYYSSASAPAVRAAGNGLLLSSCPWSSWKVMQASLSMQWVA
jgi:hypothetical protein